MSTQLESIHFFRTGDRVQHWSGREGDVTEAFALWAVVRWDDGRVEEVDQLDPTIAAMERVTRE